MKISGWFVSGLVLSLAAWLPVGAWAQEHGGKEHGGKEHAGQAAAPAAPAEQPAAPAGAAEEEPEYAFGTVKSASGDQLVINEFDYDTGEEKEMTYTVDAKTEFDNAASLKDVTAGDEVDIDYLVKDGKRVAVAVAVAKPETGEAE